MPLPAASLPAIRHVFHPAAGSPGEATAAAELARFTGAAVASPGEPAAGWNT